MNLQELKNRFESVANNNMYINTFVFDDLSSINKDRNKRYPVVLMKTPTTIDTEPFLTSKQSPQHDNYLITLYYLKRWSNEDKKTKPLELIYKECISELDGYIRDFLALGENIYYLSGNKKVSKTLGHHQHVDQLVGCSATFNLKVYNSYCTL